MKEMYGPISRLAPRLFFTMKSRVCNTWAYMKKLSFSSDLKENVSLCGTQAQTWLELNIIKQCESYLTDFVCSLNESKRFFHWWNNPL